MRRAVDECVGQEFVVIRMEEDRLNGTSAPGMETFAKHSG
jgi:hypothetical protein